MRDRARTLLGFTPLFLKPDTLPVKADCSRQAVGMFGTGNYRSRSQSTAQDLVPCMAGCWMRG